MKRSELREHIFKMVFGIEFRPPEEMPEQIRLFFTDMEELEEADQSYMEEKYARIVDRLPEIDRRIEETARSWKISRMGKVDLAVLRLAVYEMRFDDDIPARVAIDEAVEIAKKYGQESSGGFVNAILAKIVKLD